jgi:hypothetical protein
MKNEEQREETLEQLANKLSEVHFYIAQAATWPGPHSAYMLQVLDRVEVAERLLQEYRRLPEYVCGDDSCTQPTTADRAFCGRHS